MKVILSYAEYVMGGLVLLLSQHDKRQHIAFSFSLYILALGLMPAGIALLIVIIIGVIKEIWDEFYVTGFCWVDLISNCIGIVLAMPLGIFIKEFSMV